MKSNFSIPLLPSDSSDDICLISVPAPLELLPGHILKIPIPELHECTYVLTKYICGLHMSSNRLTIHTSIPCQGTAYHCMFLVPNDKKKAMVDFFLDLIKQNQGS